MPPDRSFIDAEYWQNYTLVAGVDEAGRGPLAGPVVAAAVIFPSGYQHENIYDSKKLTPKTRGLMRGVIEKDAIAYHVASVEPADIDRLNILQATRLAMRMAIEKLNPGPDFALIDGNQPPELNIPFDALVKGDARSISIAAASILAKTYRDAMMCKYDKEYPEYGFGSHKGYPTTFHREAIVKHGPCPIHRQSFLGNLGTWQQQLSLWS
jgi:ribonuclease HII